MAAVAKELGLDKNELGSMLIRSIQDGQSVGGI